MLHLFSDEELRSYCRTAIESFEMWARRLIHDEMTTKYGQNFLLAKQPDGQYYINNEIREHVEWMMRTNGERCRRVVDALFFEHISYFLCHQVFYKAVFRSVFGNVYPGGIGEIKGILKKLQPIRNVLSHANPLSVRQAEQAICYSHDLIDAIKEYYKQKGEESVWNVPRVIRITDSLGNVFDNPEDKHGIQSIYKIPNSVVCGDEYSVTVEIDSSWQPEEYTIKWEAGNQKYPEYCDKQKFVRTFEPKDVSMLYYITCTVIQHKDWHKYISYDCKVSLQLSIQPPIQ